MKKLRVPALRKKQVEQTPSRITNETVAEHREQILAGGRRFKYPIQYARHKLVINAVVITAAAVLLLAIVGAWQLYGMQNSSSFMYRLTRIFPVPVASIDGQAVRFSDYLVQYRGSEFYLSKYDELKIDSKDGKKQLEHVKREALDKAIGDAYAAKLAKQRGITVSEDDVTAVIDDQRNTVNGRISQQTYDASSRMMYDWAPSDYRLAVRRSILRSRVAFAVDTQATKQSQQAAALIKTHSGDFTKVVDAMPTTGPEKIVAGDSSLVSMVGTFGGLRLSSLTKYKVGDMAGPLTTTNDGGYYFIKVTEKSESKIRFSYLFIPLTELDKQIADLRKAGKVKEYIRVPEATSGDTAVPTQK